MRARGISAVLVAALCFAAGFATPATAKKTSRARTRSAAGGRSLPGAEGTAPRPGPAILYAPPAPAPQLENAKGSPWKASPILVSGASAYRKGEFLYQGYLYDDHGAKEVTDPSNPMHS